MVNTTNYVIPNQHPTSTHDQRHQLDDYILGLRSTAVLDTTVVVSVALFVRCAQAELTSNGLLTLDSTQYVRAITNNEKFFIRILWHYRTYVFQTKYTQTASLAGSVHTVSVGIDRGGTPTSEYPSFAVTITAVSNSNSTGGDSRFFPATSHAVGILSWWTKQLPWSDCCLYQQCSHVESLDVANWSSP